jgi:hypothetical protein
VTGVSVQYRCPTGLDPAAYASQLIASGLMRLAFERFGPGREPPAFHPKVCAVCECGSPHGAPCWHCELGKAA